MISPLIDPRTVLFGTALAAVVAFAAWRARVLTLGGAIAAWVIGTIVFGTLSWQGAAVLFSFFLPSAVLSRVGRARKRALRDIGKQGSRDGWQVFANGGVAAACAALYPLSSFQPAFAAAFAGAFAAAAADTWGTEIGTLARGTPRSIVTFAPVATGLSGGVTAAGTIATICGALFVAGVAAAVWHGAPFVSIAAGGIAGAFLDSLLGATLQALRWCPSCDRACETNPHDCGTATVMRRGLTWLENDAVNFAATLCGAAVAALLYPMHKG